jgi:hypothetical protein
MDRSKFVNQYQLQICPIELKQANALLNSLHRHHKPCQGHRFSIGVIDETGKLHGAAIVGRPVARLAGHPLEILEVTRLVTDGIPNACSMLYSAAARTGKALGYRKIQTFILEEEIGTSLKASGWKIEAHSPGGQWKHTDGKERRTDQPTGPKQRWGLILNEKWIQPKELEDLNKNDFDEFSLFGMEQELER